MPSRDLRIRIRSDDRDANRGLRGVSRTARQVSRERRRDANETRRAVEHAEEQSARAVRRNLREGVTETERAERRKRREFRETARQAENAARSVARAASRGDGGGRGGRFGGFVRGAAGVAAGVGSAAFGRVQGYQGALGVPSQQEMVQGFIRMQQDFIRASMAAGLSPAESERIQARVRDVSVRNNVDPGELLSTLSMAQTRFATADFNALQFFADHLDEIARAAQAAGGSTDEWAGAVGEMQRQLTVAEGDVPELIGAMVETSRSGSIEAGDIAANFGPLLSTYRTLRGEAGEGIGGAREFLAVAQSLGAGGRGAEGTKTAMENLFSSFSRSDVRRGIERQLGRDVFDDAGRMSISFGEFMQRASENERFQTPAGLERAGFSDAQARQAMQILLNRFRATGGNEIEALQGVNAEEGQRFIDQTVSALTSSTSGRALNVGIRAQTQFMQSGDEVVQLMEQLAGPLSDFQTRMPLAAEGISFLGEAARNAGVSIAAMRMFGMAGGVGGAGAGAAGAGGGLLGGGLLASGAAVAATGTAAFLGTIAIANETGMFSTGDEAYGGRNLGQQWEDIGQSFNAAFGVNWFDNAEQRRVPPSASLEKTSQGSASGKTQIDERSISAMADSFAAAMARVVNRGDDAARNPGGPRSRR